MKPFPIKPVFAATLADDVYDLTRQPDLGKALKTLNYKHSDSFRFAEDGLLKGKSGGPALLKCRTAFGFVLVGKGIYEGHAFIIFRGTQYLADWLTNGNVTLSRSSLGQPVHDGFNLAFKSMQPKVQEFLKLVQDRTLHCIGHSLGGALATLCAEWIRATYGIKPFLYTFGSPRAGLMGFADICTSRIGPERIFRVYHRTDVVPCMPIWPFVHTPSRGDDYYLPSPGLMVGAAYHDMGEYIDSVRGAEWKTLGKLKLEKKSEAGIEQWLKQSAPMAMTLNTLDWINQAIIYVLGKCMAGAAWVISQQCSTTLSLLDSLAFILHKGIKLTEDISSLVVYLIRKIMILLGHKPAVDAADMTLHFIRSIFIQLQRKVSELANTALGHVFAKGRAI